MNANKLVAIEGGRVRLSNGELHRRVCTAIRESNQIVFGDMPTLVAQIIENRAWEEFEHDGFASYALDAGSNGLGINTNQRLWLLRCSMDVHGKHIAEWTDVLSKVEEMVRIEAKEEGRTMRSFGGNSLESLAKMCGTSHTPKITYLPSRTGGSSGNDGHLVRLRKNHPEAFQKVVKREMGIQDARRAVGIKTGTVSNPVRAQSAFGKMTNEERDQFLTWLPENLTTAERAKLKEML